MRTATLLVLVARVGFVRTAAKCATFLQTATTGGECRGSLVAPSGMPTTYRKSGCTYDSMRSQSTVCSFLLATACGKSVFSRTRY
jgi:hypothetical protein